jgi:hypothetical protein
LCGEHGRARTLFISYQYWVDYMFLRNVCKMLFACGTDEVSRVCVSISSSRKHRVRRRGRLCVTIGFALHSFMLLSPSCENEHELRKQSGVLESLTQPTILSPRSLLRRRTLCFSFWPQDTTCVCCVTVSCEPCSKASLSLLADSLRSLDEGRSSALEVIGREVVDEPFFI